MDRKEFSDAEWSVIEQELSLFLVGHKGRRFDPEAVLWLVDALVSRGFKVRQSRFYDDDRKARRIDVKTGPFCASVKRVTHAFIGVSEDSKRALLFAAHQALWHHGYIASSSVARAEP